MPPSVAQLQTSEDPSAGGRALRNGRGSWGCHGRRPGQPRSLGRA